LDQPGGYAADVVGRAVVGESDTHGWLRLRGEPL
jgi:hypothetical protein